MKEMAADADADAVAVAVANRNSGAERYAPKLNRVAQTMLGTFQ